MRAGGCSKMIPFRQMHRRCLRWLRPMISLDWRRTALLCTRSGPARTNRPNCTCMPRVAMASECESRTSLPITGSTGLPIGWSYRVSWRSDYRDLVATAALCRRTVHSLNPRRFRPHPIYFIDYGRRRMNLPDAPIAREGFFVTHFLTVRDQEKSKDFYVRILGGKVIKPQNPCYIKLANSWI